jgi:hypothetical protein
VVASAAAKSGKGGRLVLIGVMAFLLVIAVSAAGLFLAVPMLKDAPFLRDAPFFKDASILKDAAGKDAVVGESRGAGTFETRSDTAGEARSVGSSIDGAGTEAKASGSSLDGASTKTKASGPPPAPAATDSAGLPRSLAAPPAEPDRTESAGSSAIAERAPAPAAAPPRRAPIREIPRVAVIAVGEPMFGGAAEEALETQLGRHGLDLYDERGILELRDAGGAAQIAPSSLLGMVAGRGVDVLVLIDVEPMGQRELDALGRYAYATTARVRVDALLAADGDAIGRGWSSQVEYAEPNAVSKADAAMGSFSTAIAESIEAAWRDHRSGAR